MPGKNPDLHGNVPESSPVALLLIDVINDLEFPGAEELEKAAIPMARRIAALKKRAKAAGIPTVYVNDNFGRWQSDFRKVVEHCLEDGVRGEELVRILEPEELGPMAVLLASPDGGGITGQMINVDGGYKV